MNKIDLVASSCNLKDCVKKPMNLENSIKFEIFLKKFPFPREPEESTIRMEIDFL